MAANSVTVRVSRSLPDDWWHKPLRMFWEDVLLAAHTNATEHSPVDEGHLRSSLQPGHATSIDPRNPPLWAKVDTDKQYGAALDNPGKHAPFPGWEPHYRSGPMAGQPTEGWLSDTPDRIARDIDGAVKDLADELEHVWKRAR